MSSVSSNLTMLKTLASSDFEEIPDHCLKLILSFSTPREAVRLRILSRKCREVVDQNDVWVEYLTNGAKLTLKGLKDETGKPVPIRERAVETVTKNGKNLTVVKSWGGYQTVFMQDIGNRSRYLGNQKEIQYIQAYLEKEAANTFINLEYYTALILFNYIKINELRDDKGKIFDVWHFEYMDNELFKGMLGLTLQGKLSQSDWPLLMKQISDSILLQVPQITTGSSLFAGWYFQIMNIKKDCVAAYLKQKDERSRLTKA